MARSSTTREPRPPAPAATELAPALPARDISVRRWFLAYAVLATALTVPMVALGRGHGWSWDLWLHHAASTFASADLTFKLLLFGLYLSACCTFLPLPTGWLVAGVATRQAALTGHVGSTVLLVAVVGAAASTIGNLHDYHLLTWLLRGCRGQAVRRNALYARGRQWLERSPFFWLTVFNIIPIPVDVPRLLAASCRYNRLRFAAASFLGRLPRYAVIAFVTFWWNLGWIAVVSLLALAAAMAAAKGIQTLARRALRPATEAER